MSTALIIVFLISCLCVVEGFFSLTRKKENLGRFQCVSYNFWRAVVEKKKRDSDQNEPFDERLKGTEAGGIVM
jgi:hypothetical protein